MKIIFFTNKCSQGAEILRKIIQKGIAIEAVIIEKPFAILSPKTWVLLSDPKFIVLSIFRKLKLIVWKKHQKAWLKDKFYKNFSDTIHIVDNFNSFHCEEILKKYCPDLIVLGGSRILHEKILRIPKIGVINAHPGLLPGYRGNDVIRWALYNGDPLGVTVHFVDAGVDTGPIVLQKEMTIDKNDTISTLEHKAEVLAADLLSGVLYRMIQGEVLTLISQSTKSGKQYYRMPANFHKKVIERLVMIQSAKQ